jgi:hypothetical protein
MTRTVETLRISFRQDQALSHCCQIAAKKDQVPFVVTPKEILTRHFVVAGTGFEPVTSGL